MRRCQKCGVDNPATERCPATDGPHQLLEAERPTIDMNGHRFVSPFFGEWCCVNPGCTEAWAGAEPTAAMKVDPCPSVWR